MSDHASPTDKPQEAALQTLLRLIALRDRSMTSRLLAESPSLARQAIEVGATREAARAYYFEEIAHYVYAGGYAAARGDRGLRNRHRRGACVERRER